ncbi:GntR family transcriptional regulator [Litoreibacter arenae]|uniref:Transcriptional regulator, GntR family n=1 Tax=Litoreibacter arenae DSM 19593 TaxID=1123360 RepID=S9QED2_9RHOB|nr:GntR family transcriptional regulator [Litoreibacter arenae]EPX78292.1 transcriptional regulator, GntR family [Litoreibacter arenae DSM 19593]
MTLREAPQSPIHTISKRSLHDQAVEQIRDLIIEGYLEPGQRIDEAALIADLGISRTPFREALRTLAAEGLIEIRPSRGSVVRKLSAEEVKSMLELQAHLESLAGRLACERATDAQIAELLDIHDRMIVLYEARDRLRYYKLNQAFHTQLAEAAGNSALTETQRSLQARLKRIRFIGNRQPDFWEAAVREHTEMANALRERDGKRLAETMARHLTNTWDRVRNVVNSEGR